ncbi:hypothetical protein [Parabacteroides pacaensis]|uniref:hypothetical protein n=1 Tax=Parabacteroides pacaensis TaxID=2086575 RepID=UPI00131ACDB7|nr:hypothetical protein [Parabacteroides pacaensis]
MAYSIQHFNPDIVQSDPLQVRCHTEIANKDSLLFVTGVQNTYTPNVWSTLLCDEFRKSPTNFIRKSWSDLSFLNAACSRFNSELSKFKSTLSPEKQFILDNQYEKNRKSGSSFISIQIEKNKIKYNMLGDSFLFIYNKRSKKLHAYCSMIDHNGRLDLSQPCHCLYNDLTFIGWPINGEKSLKDCICFIMSRDLANWFINNYKSNQSQTINLLLSLNNNEEYNKLLRKIQSQQSYNKVLFNKDTAELVIIQQNTEKYNIISFLDLAKMIREIKRNKKAIYICLAIIFLLICFTWIIRGCASEKGEDNIQDNPQTFVKENISPDTLETNVLPQNDFEYYHSNLNKGVLSFDEVRKMMEKAKEDKLIELNKQLYDTLNVYSEFVRLYKEGDQCYLQKAILMMFQTSTQGEYQILNSLGEEIISTNLTNGNITYLREAHQRMLIELFVGEYSNEGTVIPYDIETKKKNYRKAVNSRSIWKSFSDMK